ncbi:RNA pseudouridylate synthase domain-containing protein 4 [Habropoda laboriosa]|uniref:RNA pseudouridylate synthase domain-containing protein 4 n=1 Tax=Habropoda laboriosa TaxID=597456 RepID=A0A0L7RBI8_9HYME|nr:PREDICTED: RNA pseudouridylate synthase domain-containing protein 4-like [Habropoda laboriosa]KOC68229.1 RNA pseudouridylate synthase domain-containing protein 4 [Habropoda laboriosa]
MVALATKFCPFKHVYTNTSYTKICNRCYLTNLKQEQYKKKIHPYKQIHPWKSLVEFADDLLNNIIYDKDGLVVLNKPYGIIRGGQDVNGEIHTRRNSVPNSVTYSIQDALPHICKQLKYPQLTISKCPEKYMSGITLLAADSKVQHAIELAYVRSLFFANTFWLVTVGVPKILKGSHRLAIRTISNPQFQWKKTILTTSWSQNEEKSRKIKLFKCEYEVLSNSTLNLCSLIQLKASTMARHALRLFAATLLYTPVLGDNIYASQIQKVGDTYLKIDPFLSCPEPPKLDIRLLQLLDVSSRQREIIPAHIHLRSTILPSFFGQDILLEAPLHPSFNWTFKQLEFKYLI